MPPVSWVKIEETAEQEWMEKAAKREQDCEQKRKACEAFRRSESKRWMIVPPSQTEVRESSVRATSPDRYYLTASIENKSTVEVSALKLGIMAYDCAEASGRCHVVEQTQKIFKTNIPAGKVGQIEGVVKLSVPAGNFSWSVLTTGVQAAPSEPEDHDRKSYYAGCDDIIADDAYNR
jgi:hypothetical protein